jgi:hypothetical protein
MQRVPAMPAISAIKTISRFGWPGATHHHRTQLRSFEPGSFLNRLIYHAAPIAGNIGFTFRFQGPTVDVRWGILYL